MKEQIEKMAMAMVDANNKEMADALSMFFVTLAEALHNAGYRKQEWISVADRKPDKEGVYLVHTTYNIIETEVFYISKHDDISYWWDLDGMVTHWMPLPEPPMKGGAE